MPTLWSPADRNALDRRLDRLTPQHQRRWGKMTAPQMLAHLTDSLRMAIGELVIPSRNLPLRYAPLKQLIIYWLPFPKGVPTAPELVARTPVPAEWNAERERIRTLFAAFTARPRDGVWAEHPAFGQLSGPTWGVLLYRHIDHHLRQFDV